MDGCRRNSRRSVNVPVRWCREGSDRFVTGDYARDISKGGMCLLMRQPLENGASLRVELSLPGPRFIFATVRVKRCAPAPTSAVDVSPLFEAGVEFVSLQDEAGNEIEKFVFASFFT